MIGGGEVAVDGVGEGGQRPGGVGPDRRSVELGLQEAVRAFGDYLRILKTRFHPSSAL